MWITQEWSVIATMSKIMMIEDDLTLCTQVKEVLEDYDYQVVVIEDFRKIEEVVRREMPDLILLDMNLPYYDGNYYCRRIRKQTNSPILIISARNGDFDQILSMELGADEYITKPFNIQVLLSKINALMRRVYGEYAVSEKEEMLTLKGLTLDAKNFKLTYEDCTEELSKNEYRLMKCFLERPDEVIEREELLEVLWDTISFVDDNTLTVNVTRVKNRLDTLGLQGVIKTKRGAGYLFDSYAMGE